jgi:hypothetical protein
MNNNPPPPPGRYKSHMQNQTPAANSQAKFHISPQEASDFTNISHSKNLTTKLRELEHQWTTKNNAITPWKADPPIKKSRSNQQEDSNTIIEGEERDTLCDITDKRP